MTEYGIFEDGLCVEAGYVGDAGREAANERRFVLVATESDIEYRVERICPDHEEQPYNGCEECA